MARKHSITIWRMDILSEKEFEILCAIMDKLSIKHKYEHGIRAMLIEESGSLNCSDGTWAD